MAAQIYIPTNSIGGSFFSTPSLALTVCGFFDDGQSDWPELCSSDGKASAYNVGDPGSIPGSGGSPGEGNSNPLQYSCLENPMDRGAW